MGPKANRIMWMIPMLAWVLDKLPSYLPYDEGPPINRVDLLSEYDFIVVGGGTAGSVMGARLSEDPEVTVLVVEAGGQETPLSEVPGLAANLQLSDMDWQYRAAPSETACWAMYDHRCNLPRGRVIGGCSSINYMLYVRGNKRDYDNWEQQGNTGWGYKDLLPFFKLSEDNIDSYADPKFHNTGGFQTVGKAPWTTPLAQAFLEAGSELGYEVRDINTDRQTGFMTPHGFIRRGARCSNAKAFLRPARRRPNLHVALNSLVVKLLISRDDNSTSGVIVDQQEKKGVEVRARREVVVSAGAINTPQLLMLSGIGPAQHLARHGIHVIADLPVGQNLQDHIAGGVIFSVEEAVSLLSDRLQNFPAVLRYSLAGTGPLTTLGGVEGIAFINTKYSDPKIDWPDIELQFLAGSHGSDEGAHLRVAMGLQETYWTNYFSHLSNTDHFTVMALLSRPKSRGHILLNSASAYDHPKIVLNYLTHADDVRVLEEGIHFAIRVGNSTAFKKFGAKQFTHPVPGCEGLVGSDYWHCNLKYLTYTIYHYCGTAKMGPVWDPTAVVDPQLRVYGVSKLRVVDASVFPTIPTGNTNAPVTALAEKAANMIRTHWASYLVPAPPLVKPGSSTTNGYDSTNETITRDRGEEL
ncbi:glucose dehydrogenase [FAD, quinone] [Procambarus clarkii]|uniref:glucose dehydrogenase [FAD, quinone] n=1 Tax=Procambarus clarkii TaxID=6728 RepID=UPI001E6739EC|nr:glucose dehydrogenase [FAD, quinone]-like [Procambarus clarkii]